MPTATTSACGANSAALIYLYSFRIEAKPGKKSYSRGEIVKVFVTVTRPGEEDPTGSKVPMPRPTSQPAEGVEVGAALFVGNTYTWDSQRTTDAKGKATLNIPLPKDSDLGWAEVDIFAEKTHFSNNGCPDAKEQGYAGFPRFVKVVR